MIYDSFVKFACVVNSFEIYMIGRKLILYQKTMNDVTRGIYVLIKII